MANSSFGKIAIAHNGNITNIEELKLLLNKKYSFKSSSDAEIILHRLNESNKNNICDSLIYALKDLKGAYSIILSSKDKMIAARDPHGYRPLVLGTVDSSYVICSETCAIDSIGGKYLRDIEPGEVLCIEQDKLISYFPFKSPELKNCIFEHIYFARPDSKVFGQNVYDMRMKMGVALAKHLFVDADVVIGVPDSGTTAAIGYSQESGIPYRQGLIRSRYIGRTFISPNEDNRKKMVSLKHIPIKSVLNQKRVIVIDDSIIRGTTLKRLVSAIRNSGALEVHVMSASPPTIGPCRYGIDTPNRDKLIAANNSINEIKNIIKADSLTYLPLEVLKSIQGDRKGLYCESCFTGCKN